MMNLLKQKKDKNKFLLFCLSSLIFCFFIYISHKNKFMGVTYDEFGYMSFSAKLAGWPWQEAFQNFPFYGIGAGILWTPIFLIFDDMQKVYQTITLLNGILLILSLLLSVKCGTLLFPKINYSIIVFGCLTITFYSSTIFYSFTASSETLLYFLYWCAFFSIIKICEVKSGKWYIILSFICSYMLLVHLRTIVVIIAISVFLVLFIFFDNQQRKRKIQYLLIFLLLVFFSFLLEKQIQNIYIISNGINSDLNSVNTQVSIFEEINKIVLNFPFFVKGVIGSLYAMLVSGSFFSLFGIIFAFKNSYELLYKKNVTLITKISFLILIVFFAGMIAFNTNKVDITRYDKTVYLRYVENTVGPLFMLGAFSISRKKNIQVRDVSLFILFVMCGSYFVLRMMQLSSTNLFDTSSSVIIGSFFERYVINVDPAFTLLKINIISLSIFSIICMFLSSKFMKHSISLIISFLLMLCFWVYTGYNANVEQFYFKNENLEKYQNILDIANKYGKDNYVFYEKNIEKSDLREAKYIQLFLGKKKLEVIDTLERNEEKEKYQDSVILTKNGTESNILTDKYELILSSGTFDAYISK